MKRTTVVSLSILLVIILFGLCFSACQKKHVTSEYVAFEVEMKGDTFKILQLTDAHFINADSTSANPAMDLTLRDEWAKTAITEVIRAADPDLLVVTGDTTFTLELVTHIVPGTNDDNLEAFIKLADFIDGFNIPWLFCFGNHDEEGYLTLTPEDAVETKRLLGRYLQSDSIKNCLFDQGPTTINGVGNYIVNVLNKDKTVNTSLVLFDSGSYLKTYDADLNKNYSDQRKYEYVHDDQLDWYERAIRDISAIEGRTVPSIIYQHIPFPEYKTVLDAYVGALAAAGEEWSETINEDWQFGTARTLSTKIGEVTYYGGICNEEDLEVCCSFVGDWTYRKGKTLTYDGGHEFDRITSLGSTKYVFCGHDHRNTFSFSYKGVWLGYGMSIDYSANGLIPAPFAHNQDIYDETVQRGGTLVTIGTDGGVSVAQVPFTRNLYQEEIERRSQAA